MIREPGGLLAEEKTTNFTFSSFFMLVNVVRHASATAISPIHISDPNAIEWHQSLHELRFNRPSWREKHGRQYEFYEQNCSVSEIIAFDSNLPVVRFGKSINNPIRLQSDFYQLDQPLPCSSAAMTNSPVTDFIVVVRNRTGHHDPLQK